MTRRGKDGTDWRPRVLLALALALAAGEARAESGRISGWVTDETGVPQMGAAVTLLSLQGSIAQRVFTDQDGEFSLRNVLPGAYALEVRLARFVPLMKEGVRVRPGSRTILDVSLRSLFASLQLFSPGRGEIRDMTDDWKWVLRATNSTRPVLRVAPSPEQIETERVVRKLAGAFADTRGYAQVSGGAGLRPGGLANESDLGTSFAVATSLFGDNNVTVSGNVGYDLAAATPTTAFRTSYRRHMGLGAPEVSVTVRQLQTRAVAGRAFFEPQQGDSTPNLETFTLSLSDHVQIGPSMTLEYGALYESVQFLRRLDFVSPYGKLTRQLTPRRSLELRYASGAPRPTGAVAEGERLRQQVSALGLFPRVALRNGEATVQRTEHMEIAYRERIGRGLVEAGVYQDLISDAAVSALAPEGALAVGEALPDLFARTSTINGGRHLLRGYRVSYARKIRERLEAALGYGSTGVLSPSENRLETADAGELRDLLKPHQAHMVTASISAEAPGAGTRVVSSYQWVSRASAIGADLYNEFASRSGLGWNLSVRQPIPFRPGLPGQLEASAAFHNMLKDGYLPIQAHDGRLMFLLPAVRGYRGSLSFIF